jgi:hypothetical protein
MKIKILKYLEEYIDYKQFHSDNNQYLENLKKKFNYMNKGVSNFPEIFLKFLLINSLISPIEEIYERYIKYANIYRKKGFFEQTEIILNRLKEKLNLKLNDSINDKTLLLDEKKIKIELSYNKCLYEKGSINEAVENGRYLIELLNDEELNPYNKLDDNIKSKIYGNYAIYRINQLTSNKANIKMSRQKSENINRTFFRHKTNYLTDRNFYSSLFRNSINDRKKQISNNNNLDKDKRRNYSNINIRNIDKRESFKFQFIKNDNEVKIINNYLTLATQYNKNSYKYWNNFAMFNYRCYKYMLKELKNKIDECNEEDRNRILGFAFNAVNGFKHSLLIANKNKIKVTEDCLRFIDIFFELRSKSKDLLS